MSIQEKARWNLGDCSVREWLTYTLGYEERWFPLWRASFSSGWLIHYTAIPNASKCWTPLEFTHLDRMAGLGLMSLVLGSWCRPRIVLLAEGFIPGAWDEDFIDGLPTAFLQLDFGTGVFFFWGGSKRQREVGLPSRKRLHISPNEKRTFIFKSALGTRIC